MNRDVVFKKLESLRRCLVRVREKTPGTCDQLEEDCDLQDIIVLNLERAVQLCVDIGMHIISEQETDVPESMGDTFREMEKMGLLDEECAERMVKAVGFRNTAVHAYQQIDFKIVYSIITKNLDDFKSYARQVAAFIRD